MQPESGTAVLRNRLEIGLWMDDPFRNSRSVLVRRQAKAQGIRQIHFAGSNIRIEHQSVGNASRTLHRRLLLRRPSSETFNRDFVVGALQRMQQAFRNRFPSRNQNLGDRTHKLRVHRSGKVAVLFRASRRKVARLLGPRLLRVERCSWRSCGQVGRSNQQTDPGLGTDYLGAARRVQGVLHHRQRHCLQQLELFFRLSIDQQYFWAILHLSLFRISSRTPEFLINFSHGNCQNVSNPFFCNSRRKSEQKWRMSLYNAVKE